MKSLNHFNLLIHQRSKGKEIKPETDVYLIDTFGELNAFLALAPITFMGKSIYATGGQNPIEAILAGSAVITGEKTSNFNELYQKLESKNALVKVKNEADLKEKLAHLFEENEARKTLNNNALQFVFESKGTLTKTLKELEAFR